MWDIIDIRIPYFRPSHVHTAAANDLAAEASGEESTRRPFRVNAAEFVLHLPREGRQSPRLVLLAELVFALLQEEALGKSSDGAAEQRVFLARRKEESRRCDCDRRDLQRSAAEEILSRLPA